MSLSRRFVLLALVAAATTQIVSSRPALKAADPAASSSSKRHMLNVLFIGNSFTGRHDMYEIVKAMAEEADKNLDFEETTMIYGGRTLKDHWRLHTQNVVRLYELTKDEEQATIDDLKKQIAADPKDKYAPTALKRHNDIMEWLDKPRRKWDIVVLQSYVDDLEGDKSSYVEYTQKFADLIHAQGARVVLYETTRETQNAESIKSPPDRAPVLEKEKTIAKLARKTDATVVPMAIVALKCNEERPDLTLRYVNDAHPNKTMAYLTACTIYGAIFDRSPVGLKVDTVTDTRSIDDQHPDQDRDGGPITKKFSEKERADLQRISWEGLQEFKKLAASAP